MEDGVKRRRKMRSTVQKVLRSAYSGESDKAQIDIDEVGTCTGKFESKIPSLMKRERNQDFRREKKRR